MKLTVPQTAVLSWVKVNKPELLTQITRWFEAPNEVTKSMADLVLMSFEAGRSFQRTQKTKAADEIVVVDWSESREKSE